MSYDANSPQARKGKIGEQIVKAILADCGADVKRPENVSDDEPTLIDFHAVPKTDEDFRERFVEVKVRTAIPYAYGQYQCYAFPVVQIEAYKNFAAQRGLDCELWIVDPDEGKLYYGSLTGGYGNIEVKQFIYGRDFPFNQTTKRGLMRFYHRLQFCDSADLSKKFPEELAALRAIDIELAEDELDQQLLEYFGQKFPDAVIDGLHQLNREFSGNQILNAIQALKDRDDDAFSVLLDKLLNGSKAPALPKMFLYRIRAELEKPSTSTETSTVKPNEKPTVEELAEMSLNVLIKRLATAVNLSADDLAEAILEMRSIRFDEQQDRLKARLLGGTKHD